MVGAVVALALLGVLMVWSATRGPVPPYRSAVARKQLLFVGLGLTVAGGISVADYGRLRHRVLPMYLAVVALLVAVLSPLGARSKGAQAWFQVGGFQFEPAEAVKLGVILFLASLAAHYDGVFDGRRVGLLLAAVAAPFVLIMVQPDLGTGLVLVAVAGGVLLVAGVSWQWLAVIVAVGVLAAAVLLQSSFLKDYQRARLTSFLAQDQASVTDPSLRQALYNVDQSKTAIGAGGLAGEGLFQGSQTRLGNVPEQHTDFIFTAVGEQLGLVGSATVLALFSIIVWRMWRAAQLARDQFGTLICVGVLSMVMFQVFENIGMTMGIMPVTGIPLPFLSYGGSATLAEFVAVGLVLNVHMRRYA
jgi:rod shape determining protein RodA